MTGQAFDSMLEVFDPALEEEEPHAELEQPFSEEPLHEDNSGEIEPDRSLNRDPSPKEPGVGHEDAAEDDGDQAGDAARVPDSKGRIDLKAEATSLRHLLTHLPKNSHCVFCQQAKMRQRYSHKRAVKR